MILVKTNYASLLNLKIQNKQQGYMVPFLEFMKNAAASQHPVEGLQKTNEAFKTLLYDESEEPLSIDAEFIKAVDKARVLTESFVALPEIEDTDYLNEVLENMENAIAAFIQSEITVDEFWNHTVELARLVHYLSAALKYFHENDLSIGQNPDPSVSIAISADGSIQLYGRLNEEAGLSMEKAQAIQAEFEKAMGDDNSTATQLINLAGRLLTSQRFEGAIKAFTVVMNRFPEESAQCLNAIGACHFYLQDYEQAIQYYMKALREGESEERVAYNVWESCDALIKHTQDRNERMRWRYYFEEHFPNSGLKLEI